MAIDDDVRAVYEYLTTQVLPGANQPTVTYGQIEQETGVPIGEYGGHIGRVLGEISRRCSDQRLPPLTSIVLPRQGSFASLHILTRRASEGSEALPSLARRVRMSFFGARVIINATDGIPGSGYLVEMAQMLRRGNPGGWRIDQGIERWDQKPAPRGFSKDLDRWNYRPMIAENQESVWAQPVWPRSL